VPNHCWYQRAICSISSLCTRTIAASSFRSSGWTVPLCLHVHLISEARERQIPLQQVLADLSVTVSNSWDLEAVVAAFQLRLDPGASAEARAHASDEAIGAMRDRMQHSPVPRNRPAAVPMTLTIALQN
jgi:hypothetical protein